MDPQIQEILNTAKEAKRITPEDALYLLKYPVMKNEIHQDIIQTAHAMREQKISKNFSSFTMFRVINYTNVCNIGCSFCSFRRNNKAADAYSLSPDEVRSKVEDAIRQEAKQIFFQGGVNPHLPLSYYIDMLRIIKEEYHLPIRAFSPVEIYYLAQYSQLSVTDLLIRLQEAGLDSLPGAGAEILNERVRQILSPLKLTVPQWVDVMRAAHKLGIRGSANIVFGSVEKDEEIIDHLSVIRQLQDETGGLYAFIPWTFQPQTKEFQVQTVSGERYVRMVAICRIFLDNIAHIEASVLGMGMALGKAALYAGADDISSPVIEENVMQSQGLNSKQEAIQFIHDCGFHARERDFSYNTVAEYPNKNILF